MGLHRSAQRLPEGVPAYAAVRFDALLKLQHEPERAVSYQSFAPVEWSESLQSWCVYDPVSIIFILKSYHFVVIDYTREFENLERRTGVCWADVVHALHHMPLAKEGARHSELRREFAKLISAQSGPTKEVIEGLVARVVTAVFRAGCKAELVQEVLRPIMDALFRELIGVPPPKPVGPSASQIFDRSLGLNRRRGVQAEVSRLSKVIKDNAEALKTSLDCGVALMILGHDALLGSLGSSLTHVLREGAGLRLSEMRFPESLPETGVPYLERVATADCVINEFSFRAGDRVRLFLDACPARGVPIEEAPFFGKGRHICLGMELSQWLWRTLAKEFARIPLRVHVNEVGLRQRDYVFRVYDSIKVSFYE